jgi:hypothetical protein
MKTKRITEDRTKQNKTKRKSSKERERKKRNVSYLACLHERCVAEKERKKILRMFVS